MHTLVASFQRRLVRLLSYGRNHDPWSLHGRCRWNRRVAFFVGMCVVLGGFVLLLHPHGTDRSTSDRPPVFLSPPPVKIERTTPLLFIVSSASRPNHTDYVTPLLHSLVHAASRSKVRVMLYDVDPPGHRREQSWFDNLPSDVEVVRAPLAHYDELATVNTDPARDKHHDPTPRIRWRTKGAKDLHFVLALAHAQSEEGWPYAIVLDDDIQLSSAFFARLHAILTEERAWLAWVLFHAEAFDQGRVYADGDLYRYEACAQAILFRTAGLRGLAEYVGRNWRTDPADWQLRDYQRLTNAMVRVAEPSLVQHIGRVSSLGLKSRDGGGIASGCWSKSFVD